MFTGCLFAGNFLRIGDFGPKKRKVFSGRKPQAMLHGNIQYLIVGDIFNCENRQGLAAQYIVLY
jgi:hypothetical protein